MLKTKSPFKLWGRGDRCGGVSIATRTEPIRRKRYITEGRAKPDTPRISADKARDSRKQANDLTASVSTYHRVYLVYNNVFKSTEKPRYIVGSVDDH